MKSDSEKRGRGRWRALLKKNKMQEPIKVNIDEYIDRNEINQRLDGDIVLLRELADIFSNDADNLLDEIHRGIESHNSDKIRKSSHTLKGAVANFSAKRAFDSACLLEKIGQSKSLSGAESAFAELKKNLSGTIAAINALAEKKSIV